MERVEKLFEGLWQDYIQRLCPSAAQVHDLLTEDEPLLNDHIALRTFNLPKVGLDRLAAPFIAIGYKPCGKYHFEAKKLYAEHFEHPNPRAPKVFISELMVGQFSSELQQAVRELVNQVPEEALNDPAFLYGGRLWELDFATYDMLSAESEYAGWVAAHGYGANHFTVSINQLEQFTEVVEVNQLLRHNGFVINESGGEVKGSPEVLLEQSSTMADRVDVGFTDGVHSIPGGFYEFAKRYPMPDGELYSGFVEASADKIFESTNM
ncbi:MULTISPECIES: DUF1338 domain-containing protein [Photobacterium]|uniref:2-oxoadipate dioxygenase/decarboxylase n=1 Tax=Photobacterium ganghwense TaxID=320778 RepID=A0A0J1JTL1_9GAMM|nr:MULTISPECIES: DUF1338 domain-containing protein [Photobacterium]KLV05622.1 succinyldiaminopimelate aminotransferase [Photobacterium ganghwense]MBV1839522.1 DUF1338 domain-containing protein [Photobacterium ganghwense]PSU06156.1 DUF1338 domain-containing protein [Photobacterium ganghwense]QSV14311.1 DUF1338 domain-containing protein [Photobacterium ganghwense]